MLVPIEAGGTVIRYCKICPLKSPDMSLPGLNGINDADLWCKPALETDRYAPRTY